MEIRNISKKIIGICGKTLMPGDRAEFADSEVNMDAVRSMERAGRLELTPGEPLQPQEASEDGKPDNTPSEEEKPKEKARKGARKPAGNS